MATATKTHLIHFPDYYDDLTADEVCDKGWFNGVSVEFNDGRRFSLFFYDPVRLSQDLRADSAQDRPFVAEPGMIVLPEVTREAICRAVDRLVDEGFFEHLVPQSASAIPNRNGVPQSPTKTVA